jgi:nicotinamidase-related amidase
VSDTVLLSIDLQMGFVCGSPSLYDAENLLTTVADLQNRARAAGVPVVHVQFAGEPGHPAAVGTEGFAFHPRVAPRPGEQMFVKRWTDSFQQTGLEAHLRSTGCRRLVVVGCVSELCIDTTCRRALSIGFPATLVADGHSTSDFALFDELSPEIRIRQTNHVLQRIETNFGAITVCPAADIDFAAPHLRSEAA